MSQQHAISPKHKNRMRVQGYSNGLSDEQLRDLTFGNRFAYAACTSVLILGVAFASIPVLSVMMGIAFFGIILPNHPFDYIYNYVLRQPMNKPMLPRRSPQLKFACTVATIWIGVTIYLFQSGLMPAGYMMGASLIGVAGLVSATDICIPSIIYNFLFRVKIEKV